MANIADRLAASRSGWHCGLLVVLLALVLSACSAGANLTEPPPPSPTADVAQASPTPTRLPFAATQTAAAGAVPYVLERVVLATEIEDDGAPANEVSVISEEQENIFLTVRIRDLPAGSRFQAIWMENDQEIGRSDESVADAGPGARWVALPFRPIARLNPAAAHSVELVIDDRRIDSYAFRVGVGDASDIIAESTLALGTDDEGEPIKPGETFDRFTPQVVLIARISNLVNPEGMVFTTYWIREGLVLAQRPPDGGQPRLTSDPPDPNDRTMTFTFVPEGNIVPGEYDAALFLNGQEIARYAFTIVPDEMPSVTPSPTERVGPTQTPSVSEVTVADVQVVESVDEETSEPDGDSITTIEAYPGEVIPLHVAVSLEDLRIDDEVEFTIGIGNSIIDRYPLPFAAFDDGWLAADVDFRAPDLRNDTVEYEIVVYINGSRAHSTSIEIESNQTPPSRTPTPSTDDDDDG